MIVRLLIGRRVLHAFPTLLRLPRCLFVAVTSIHVCYFRSTSLDASTSEITALGKGSLSTLVPTQDRAGWP